MSPKCDFEDGSTHSAALVSAGEQGTQKEERRSSKGDSPKTWRFHVPFLVPPKAARVHIFDNTPRALCRVLSFFVLFYFRFLESFWAAFSFFWSARFEH